MKPLIESQTIQTTTIDRPLPVGSYLFRILLAARDVDSNCENVSYSFVIATISATFFHNQHFKSSAKTIWLFSVPSHAQITSGHGC